MARSLAASVPLAAPGPARYPRAARLLRRHAKGLFGLAVFGVAVVGAVAAPWLSSYNPDVADAAHRLIPPAWTGGTGAHLLGTDQLGRDLLTRLLYGSRVSLAVGMLAVLVSAPIGVVLGLAAGFHRGVADEIIMRVVDSQLSIPFLLLAIAIIAAIGAGTAHTILVLGITGWPMYARMIRAEALSLREREFVESARAAGASDGHILFRHLLPHVVTTTSVIASFAVADMILSESTLSFLGLGVQPPTSSWGQMLADAKSYVGFAPWLSVFPGVAIAVTVLAINFIGDWARDLLNPQLQRL